MKRILVATTSGVVAGLICVSVGAAVGLKDYPGWLWLGSAESNAAGVCDRNFRLAAALGMAWRGNGGHRGVVVFLLGVDDGRSRLAEFRAFGGQHYFRPADRAVHHLSIQAAAAGVQGCGGNRTQQARRRLEPGWRQEGASIRRPQGRWPLTGRADRAGPGVQYAASYLRKYRNAAKSTRTTLKTHMNVWRPPLFCSAITHSPRGEDGTRKDSRFLPRRGEVSPGRKLARFSFQL